MNHQQNVRNIVDRFVEAFNTNNAQIAPLAGDVIHSGPMLPEPLRGETEVRRHIAEVAPFVARMEIRRMVAEDDSAAVIFELKGLNGVVIEGAEFFRFHNGLICDDRVFFDTRSLLQGSA